MTVFSAGAQSSTSGGSPSPEYSTSAARGRTDQVGVRYHSITGVSTTFGPTGVPTLDRLGAFIDEYRRRMDTRNGDIFAASAGAWWRYYEFLAIVLARYDR